MNIEKYTQNAQQAVLDCQNIATEMSHQMVDGEHVHLALLQQKDGLIPKLLTSMNVDVDRITKDVRAELDKLPKVSGGGETMYGTRRFNNIFMNAEKMAERRISEHGLQRGRASPDPDGGGQRGQGSGFRYRPGRQHAGSGISAQHPGGQSVFCLR